MIEEELRTILSGEDDQADKLNRLVDQFRDRRDSSELLGLLNSCDNEFVRIGAWILSEIPFNRYNIPDVIARLYELSRHETPLVRLYALGAIFPALDRTNSDCLALIARLRDDDIEGVRMGAEAAARRLGIE